MDSPTRFTGLAAAAAALACTLGLAASAHAATTYNVTAGDASSLESAVNTANTDGDDSIVNVPAGTYTLNGDGMNIADDGSFTLTGAGARSTIIDSAATPGSGSTIFTVDSSDATISGVTLENASVDDDGGAIFVSEFANLILTDSTLTNNETAFSGENGGAIFNEGNLDVERDTFSSNRSADDGSAIDNETVQIGSATRGRPLTGNLNIVNSTFTGNESDTSQDNEGFGTITVDSGFATLTNDTIAQNLDDNGEGNAGLTVFTGDADVLNTIIANNTVGTTSPTTANCFNGKGGFIISQGHNIESGEDCNFTSSGDQQDTDPKLGPLQNNGGQMDTMALLAGSPAIDKADSMGCPPTDEIGTTRPQGPACDIGAYEVPPAPPAQPQPPAQPAPAPAPPAQPAAPKVSVAGVRRACVSSSFHLRFHIATAASVKSVKVKLDGRTIKSTSKSTFTLTINSRRLKAGRHRVTITATDSNGKTTTSHRTFSVCKAAKPRRHAAPRFTG